MGKYIKVFATHSEYESYMGGSEVSLPNVSICNDIPELHHVHYNTKNKPLKFTAVGASTLGLGINGNVAPVFEKSADGSTWESWDYSEINVADGESIYIRGENPNGLNKSWDNYCCFWMDGSFNCEGNIMSLVGQHSRTIPCDFCFGYLFDDCDGLLSAPELPATILAPYCYCYMFYYCTSLVNAPELPAVNLVEGCYEGMFCDCTSLVKVPELPVTILAPYCYNDMFDDCYALVKAPELPATTLAEGCYTYMFWNCTSLVNAPVLPATNLPLIENSDDGCYREMFYGCTSLGKITCLAEENIDNNCSDWVYDVPSTGTFTKSANATWTTGDSGIPEGWTVVNK